MIILDKKLKAEINEAMVQWCHTRGCYRCRNVEWDGSFIDKWFCDNHKKEVKQNG